MNAVLLEDCRGALQVGVALLLQSGLLLLLGLAAGWLLRRRGPELRAFVAQMTLAGVALGAALSLSLFGHVRPVWRVSLPSASVQEAPPTLRIPPPRFTGEDKRFAARVAASPPLSALPAPSVSPAPLLNSPPRHGEVASPGSPGWVFFLLWPAVTGLHLLWLLACQGHLARLRRTASPLAAGPAAEALAQLSALRRVRAPLLLQSPHVRSPFLAGVLRPAIFLPVSWKADFDDATLRAVLAHELAHLTRRDCAWTLLLRLTTALLWPQPLLWLLARQLDQATEEACDVSALTPDCPPRRYADCLLRLADRALPGPAARTLGAGVVPVRSSVGRRIQTLLDRRNHAMTPLSTRLRVAVTLGTSIIAAGLSVAFASSQNGPISKQTSSDPVPAAARVGSPQSGLSNASGGEKRLMYGILWGPFPKHMLGHRMGYFISAMADSPAAQAGIPTQSQSTLVSINEHPAKGSQRVVAALFRLPPPLLITFMNVAGQTRQATLRSKAMISALPLNSLSMLLTRKKVEQENYTTARYWLAVLDKQLHEEVSKALSNPTSPGPEIIKRGVLLECEIGARNMSIGTLKQAMNGKYKHSPKVQMRVRVRAQEQQEEARLKPLFVQEAQLFPQTQQTNQRLKDVHTQAERVDRQNMIMTLCLAETEATDSEIRNLQRDTHRRTLH